MKLTTQLVVLILGSIFGMVALVVCLAAWADWQDGSVVGMVAAFGTLATSIIVAIRNQQKTSETLEEQDKKLAKIDRQTNGLSSNERQEIAERAATATITRLKNSGHL